MLSKEKKQIMANLSKIKRDIRSHFGETKKLTLMMLNNVSENHIDGNKK